MNTKIRHITDNIHDTIYLSGFESSLIETPYFHRLHDVYQSSTVYLAFPANRTKRYEHSLGAMELSSELFFSAISNADANIKKDFLEELYVVISNLYHKIQKRECTKITYYSKSNAYIESIFKSETHLKELIKIAIENDIIKDSALSHYIPNFFDTMIESEDVSNSYHLIFTYQIILEAVRIAALFHDVGHPPYSHVVEEIINLKYREIENCDCENVNANEFKEIIDRIIKENKSFLIENESDVSENSALHECIGKYMLQQAMEEVVSSRLNEINKDKSKISQKRGLALYTIAVTEFVFAILYDSNELFALIHQVFDGPLDADRLDYIVRDSHNAGVDWGRIPYKRITQSLLLAKTYEDGNDKYCFAFPTKLVNDIEDTFITRYKIFSRINYHHKSNKTATILQKVIGILIDDYFELGKDSICCGISDLWKFLDVSLDSQSLKVIEWNDSWLITLLYGVLVKLSSCQEEYENYNQLRSLLEELLLNKNMYFTVFKRISDEKELMAGVFKKPSITSFFDEQYTYEKNKEQNNDIAEKEAEAIDSIRRIDGQRIAIEEGNINLLLKQFPFDYLSCFEKVLKELKDDNMIEDYIITINKGRDKLGLNLNDCIYLYDKQRNITILDNSKIIEELSLLRSRNTQLFVYINFDINNKDDIKEKIEGKLADLVENSLREQFRILFNKEL